MRAFHRGYDPDKGRQGPAVRRLHIMRETGNFAGRQGLCGSAGWAHRTTTAVVIDPLPAEPPPGLEWCPACVGRAAENAGQLRWMAAALAAL
ncbi:hypothetical protein [Streptomyces sp. NBC_01237]|uniref:hypothetical protein n=1 Tax=Streptomyces sp. NBC_01237 TaxID=2903790 RepID=UPI002DD8BE6B|nr:hypothetical protein [Streptomyces sp. NBC_01237]WRZ73807.1 hypothetical protein OG251_20415 [Streptomyces sp. NBC_01237]